MLCRLKSRFEGRVCSVVWKSGMTEGRDRAFGICVVIKEQSDIINLPLQHRV